MHGVAAQAGIDESQAGDERGTGWSRVFHQETTRLLSRKPPAPPPPPRPPALCLSDMVGTSHTYGAAAEAGIRNLTGVERWTGWSRLSHQELTHLLSRTPPLLSWTSCPFALHLSGLAGTTQCTVLLQKLAWMGAKQVLEQACEAVAKQVAGYVLPGIGALLTVAMLPHTYHKIHQVQPCLALTRTGPLYFLATPLAPSPVQIKQHRDPG